ncbi:hypothetical protein FNV43_RR20643 [Rhamnella rubrinervis]|uniref:Mediator of RNA polymerase II transcription subunit 25 n=1 Tax=Rhamnella rubrinervis TaxID=2594499 RepID=A0A8K0E6X0_9ROSA|nr:hypothetical protein FNV43_RR20643 [Rhamnella rubrinervis]
MAVKWLVVVVDGTAATRPFWPTILSDYLDRILRYFCLQTQLQESFADSIVELGLIEYKSHGLDKGWLVQPSSWTRDVNKFMEWLAALPFNGGALTESAIAEGLAEALVMFPKQPNGVETYQQQVAVGGGERHCILVASSNPNSLPRPLYMPIIKNGGFLGLQTEWCLGDVETVANSYAQGNDKTSEVGSVNNNDGNDEKPDFFVLISEKFPEAKAAILLNNQRQQIISTSHHVSLEFDSNSSSLSQCGDDLLGPVLSEEDMDFLWEILNEPTPAIQHSPAESIGEVEPAATVVSSAAEIQPVPSTTTNTVSATNTAQRTPQTYSSSPLLASYQCQINQYEAMSMAEIMALDYQSFNNDHHLHAHHSDNDRFSSQFLRSSIIESHQASESSGASVLVHDQTRFINGGRTVLQSQHHDHQTSMSSPPLLIPELETLMGTLMQQSTEKTTSSGSLYITDHYFVAPTINASGSSSMTFHHQHYLEWSFPVPRDHLPKSSAQTTSSAGSPRVSASTSSGAVNIRITNSRSRVPQPYSGAPRSSWGNYNNNNGNHNLQQRSVPGPKALTRSRRSDQGGRVLSINNGNHHQVGAFKNHMEELYGGAGSSTHASTAGNRPPGINGGMGPFVVPNVVYENERYEPAWSGSISAQYQEQLILVSRAKCIRFNLGSQTLIFSPTKTDLRFMGTLFHEEHPEYKDEAPIGQFPEARGRQQTEEAAAYGGALAWALLSSNGFQYS